MAHSCPDCSSACYCGGDIDDMLMDGGSAEAACRHCEDDAFLEDDPNDCLECGTCDSCIQRSIAYAEEMAKDGI